MSKNIQSTTRHDIADLITMKEAVQLTGMADKTIRDACKSGKIYWEYDNKKLKKVSRSDLIALYPISNTSASGDSIEYLEHLKTELIEKTDLVNRQQSTINDLIERIREANVIYKNNQDIMAKLPSRRVWRLFR